MKLNCLIYTTVKPNYLLKDLAFIRECLLKTKGRESVTFTLRQIPAPKSIVTIKDDAGHIRPSWAWFEEQFVTGLDASYNAVAFHFTDKEKKRWGVSNAINGTYHRNSDDVLDFWLCADPREQARKYPFSEFTRIMLHEISHGDVHWTGATRELVHEYDYLYNRIHELPAQLTYEKWNLLSAVKALFNKLKPSTMKPDLLDLCTRSLGTDVTPDDLVPDVVACAITVSTLINKIDSTFPKVAGTWTLYDILAHRKDYYRVTTPQAEDIIISPTGMGKGSGHTGIFLDGNRIASNDSASGKFIQNYTLDSWTKRYKDTYGFPIFMYRKKGA